MQIIGVGTPTLKKIFGIISTYSTLFASGVQYRHSTILCCSMLVRTFEQERDAGRHQKYVKTDY